MAISEKERENGRSHAGPLMEQGLENKLFCLQAPVTFPWEC